MATRAELIKEEVDKAIKKYATRKNRIIGWVLVAVCVMVLVFVKVRSPEWKIKNEQFKELDKNFKRLDEQYKEKVLKDSLKVDSLEKVISINSQKREKEIIKIVHGKEIRIKEINKPSFSNDDIRKGFGSN